MKRIASVFTSFKVYRTPPEGGLKVPTIAMYAEITFYRYVVEEVKRRER
jgi:hypothetical protein